VVKLQEAADALQRQQESGNGARPPPDGDNRELAGDQTTPCLDDLIDAYHGCRTTGSRKNFARLLEKYQGADREIVDQYFAKHIHAGVLHICRRTRFQKRKDFEIRMKYPGEKVAVVQPEFEAALWRARAMEQQTALVVAGRPRRVLLEMLFSVIVYLLGVLDSLESLPADATQGRRETEEPSRVHRIEQALQTAQCELTRLQMFADQASVRSALRHYVVGVFIGGVAVFALSWTASSIQMFEETPTQDLVRAIAAGGLGAIISVMIRISHGQRLDVDPTQGDSMTCLAGSFRPVVGGALGVALYVLLKADLIPLQIPTGPDSASYFFTAIAFLAGFSERWAQDTIVRSTPLPTSASSSPIPSTRTPLPSAPTDGAAGSVKGGHR
jgi:hypothetical protein